MKLPRTRPGVILQRDQGDLFLLDTERGEVFEVNATAAAIFELCEGGASYDGAVAQLAAGLSEPGQEPEILLDVQATVRSFQELGICDADG
jgi:hypothetical protein